MTFSLSTFTLANRFGIEIPLPDNAGYIRVSAGQGTYTDTAFGETGKPRYKYKVKVQTPKGTTSFDFFDSQSAYEQGEDYLSSSNLKYALACFMRDAEYGLTDFEDFCSSLGYDTDSRRAEKIWKACQRATNKLNKLGLYTDDDFFSSLLNWLED